jgi:hypothetical protein
MNQKYKVDKIVQELHPCFAGYLHDGEITERDEIASIFQLFKTKCLKPVWENDFFSGNIVRIKKTGKIPEEVFEQKIVELLFQNNMEIPVGQVTSYIKNGQIKEIIKQSIEKQIQKTDERVMLRFESQKLNASFSALHKLPFFGPVQVDHFDSTPSGAKMAQAQGRKLVQRLFFGIGVFMVVLSFWHMFITEKFDIRDEDLSFPLSVVWAVLGFIIIFGGVSLLTKMSVNFKPVGLKDPYIKNKMSYLFEFISNHPLNNHNFNNEFLPYSIAFGIDNSWNKNFSIGEGVKLEKSALDVE